MHGADKVLGSFEFALNECFVDGHLDNDLRQFAHGCLKFLEIS